MTGAKPFAALAALLVGCSSARPARPPLRPMTELEAEEARVHPEVRALLAGLEKPPPGDAASMSAAEWARRDRARWASLKPFTAPHQEVERVQDLRAEGPQGPIPLRVFWPLSGAGLPAAQSPALDLAPADLPPDVAPADLPPIVIYLHGGEYTAGSLELYDSTFRALASGARAVVVAVAYRLAPEARFPAASADVNAAVRWVFAHAEELHADAARVALAGDDAGATLAVGSALELAQPDGPPLRALALAYPLLDARLRSASWREFGDLPYLLTRDDFSRALSMYLGRASPDDPRVSPLLLGAPELAKLPRTLVLTAELDPARDEAEPFASALQRAGGEAEVRRYPGMVHGFLLLAGAVEPAAEALDGFAAFLRQALEKRPR
jgi:acetyl esterase